MLRQIASALVGILVAFAMVALIQRLGHAIYPPPPELAEADARALAAAVATLPLGSLLFVVAAWAIGSFAGAAVASLLTRGVSLLPGLAVGALVLAATAMTLFALPHPVWMMIAGLVLPLPAAWLGCRAARRAPPG